MATFLHIGTHKTGTTTLQSFARLNAATLRERGLFYPDYDLFHRPGASAHHQFAHAVAGAFDQSQFRSGADPANFIEAVAAARRAGENVLISAEPIYRHAIAAADAYDAGPETYLRRLAALLTPLGEIVVVLCIRRQDLFAASLYQEEIKTTRQTFGFEDFVQFANRRFAYLRNYGLFKTVFGAVDLLIYETLTSGRGLVVNFFARLDVDLSDAEAMIAPSNESLHPAVIAYKRRLNASAEREERVKFIGGLLPAVSKTLYGAERRGLVPEPTLRDFFQSCDADNQALAALVAGDPARPLFPPRAPLPELYDGLGDDEEARIAAEVKRLLRASVAAR